MVAVLYPGDDCSTKKKESCPDILCTFCVSMLRIPRLPGWYFSLITCNQHNTVISSANELVNCAHLPAYDIIRRVFFFGVWKKNLFKMTEATMMFYANSVRVRENRSFHFKLIKYNIRPIFSAGLICLFSIISLYAMVGLKQKKNIIITVFIIIINII